MKPHTSIHGLQPHVIPARIDPRMRTATHTHTDAVDRNGRALRPFRLRHPSHATAGAMLTLVTLFGSQAIAQVPVAPAGLPVSAVEADRPLAMPTANAYGFENLFPVVTVPPPNPYWVGWGPWRAYGTSGVTKNGSALLNGLTAPEGVAVGYISGDGRLQCSYAFSAGIWRLRYQGAARSVGGVPQAQVLQISVGGTVLAEHAFSAAFETVTTRPIHLASAATLTVAFEGLDPAGTGDTAFIDQILLERVSDWQDPASWDLGVPGATNPVTIPDDALVALDGTCTADSVTVNGPLVAPELDGTLDTHWVRVTGDAAVLQVGTADVPFEHDFTLTLLGTQNDPQLPMVGSKFLVAEEGGVIDLHGAPRVSWTKLDATVDASTTPPILTLAEDVDWQVDDWLIVAGSQNQPVDPGAAPYGSDWTDFAEKVQIKTVLGPRSVELDQPLAHRHFGGAPQGYPTGGSTWQLDQRAEVGLLTHDIVVQGDANSDLFQPSTGHGWVGYGGHIMIRRSSTGHGTGRLSNVELFRMGQSKTTVSSGLGRYPMHWHMNLDDGAGQYIEHSSIHHTYNRAVTVHGTEYARVEWNVAYDNLGHAVFLEDGSERFNHINYNLVLSTQIPDPANALLDSDEFGHSFQNQSPSSFWITDPNNEMIGNVAAGTVGTGFWFAFPTSPAGLSANEMHFANLAPNLQPLGTFRDNVCHGARSAFDVNDAFDVNHQIQTNVAWHPPAAALLEDFTVYSCYSGLYAGTGDGDLHFVRNVLADNQRSITFAAYHTVEDSVVIADSFHGLVTLPNPSASAYSIYDGAGTLRNSHLAGYDAPGTGVLFNIGGASKHVNHTFAGLTFEPSGPAAQILTLPDFASAPEECGDTPQSLYDPRKWIVAIRDEDGSLTGTAGVTITGNHPMMNRTLATGALRVNILPEDVAWPIGHNTWISPYRFGQLRVRHNNAAGNPVQGPVMWFQRDPHPLWTTNVYKNCSTVDQHKQFPIVVGGGYEYGVYWGDDPTGVSPTYVPPPTDQLDATLDDLAAGDDGTVRLVWLGAKSQIVINGRADGTPFTPTAYTSLASLQSGATTGYYIPSDDSAVWLRYVSSGERTIKLSLNDVLP